MPLHLVCTLLLYFGTCAYLFLPDEGSCYIFSTRNNCCEFLASSGVIIQSVTQSLYRVVVTTNVCDCFRIVHIDPNIKVKAIYYEYILKAASLGHVNTLPAYMNQEYKERKKDTKLHFERLVVTLFSRY